MLLAGWEIRIGINCDRGLENAARGRGPRAAFSSPRSQFFPLYGPTLSRPITFLSFYSCRKLAHEWVTRRLQFKPFAKNLTSERTSKSNTIRRKMY